MTLCYNCGQAYPDNSSVCRACGYQCSAQIADPADYQAPPVYQPQALCSPQPSAYPSQQPVHQQQNYPPTIPNYQPPVPATGPSDILSTINYYLAQSSPAPAQALSPTPPAIQPWSSDLMVPHTNNPPENPFSPTYLEPGEEYQHEYIYSKPVKNVKPILAFLPIILTLLLSMISPIFDLIARSIARSLSTADVTRQINIFLIILLVIINIQVFYMFFPNNFAYKKAGHGLVQMETHLFGKTSKGINSITGVVMTTVFLLSWLVFIFCLYTKILRFIGTSSNSFPDDLNLDLTPDLFTDFSLEKIIPLLPLIFFILLGLVIGFSAYAFLFWIWKSACRQRDSLMNLAGKLGIYVEDKRGFIGDFISGPPDNGIIVILEWGFVIFCFAAIIVGYAFIGPFLRQYRTLVMYNKVVNEYNRRFYR